MKKKTSEEFLKMKEKQKIMKEENHSRMSLKRKRNRIIRNYDV